MASNDLEERILKVLRESGKPMRALDIGKALGFSGKKEVNQLIYKIKGVKKVDNPNGSAPLWQLDASTGDTTAQLASESGACRKKTSAPVNQLGSQLSRVTIGDQTTATWSGGKKLLTTMEQSPDGALIIRPLSRDEVIRQSESSEAAIASRSGPSNVQATPDGDDDGPAGQPRGPVQETATGDPDLCDDTGKASPLSVDSINFKEGIKVKKEFEKDSGDNPGKNTKCFNQNYTTLEKDEDLYSQPSPASSATTSKKKSKIAANLDLSLQDTISKRTRIVEILADGPLDTHQVSLRLGMPTRVEAMQLLEELERDGRVRSIRKDGVSVWSLAQ